MTTTEAFSNLRKAIDNMSQTIDKLYNIYNDLPKYLRKELQHPKKKPRGSIRRARKRSESE